jgi:hypothetical protein
MPGVQRRPTVAPKKIEEEAQPKDKIKFDIFNDEEESPDYKKKTELDNVRMLTIIVINIERRDGQASDAQD